MIQRHLQLGLTPDQRPYEPFGTAVDVMYARDRQLMVHGPAGTGKSRGILEKHHLIASKYPGARILWLRKTRKRLTESALVTFEDHVLPLGSPIKRGPQRETRSSYRYPNGSVIALLGLDDDNVDQVMSTEWDHIYVQEAIEVTDEVWDKCNMRLRNGRTGYHQLVGDTNPGAPTHWIKQRMDAGRLHGIQANHRDNPRFYDHIRGVWTPEGEEYLKALSEMRGHLRDRYLSGRWVAAEGARWPELSEEIHGYSFRSKFRAGLPASWPRILGADYGLRAPYAALWFAADQDGDLWAYRERYRPGLKAWQQAREILDATGPEEYIRRVRMDPAMWQDFPAHEEQTGKSAADYYESVLGADPRFGPLEPGFNRSRMLGQITIDNLLARDNDYPNLYIDKDLCPNLWMELEGAVWSDKERKEDIDDKCPDHAITATIYGLHGYVDAPAAGPKPIPSQEEIRRRIEEERLANDRKQLERTVRAARF